MNDDIDSVPEKGPGLIGHDDERSDIEQAVKARSDAVDRGEGGAPEPSAGTGDYSGNAGTGGEVKNQDVDAQ